MYALDSWIEERRSAYLYRIIAKQEKIKSRQQLFSQFAQEAENQAQIWTLEVEKNGHKVPEIYSPEVGLDTLAREELGLNPDELGSPWLAAFSSFFAFTAGGAIPLLPYLFAIQQHALQVSIGLTALSLFGVGATLSLFTGRNAVLGGLRMLFIGGAAGLLIYWIGNFMGARLA